MVLESLRKRQEAQRRQHELLLKVPNNNLQYAVQNVDPQVRHWLEKPIGCDSVKCSALPFLSISTLMMALQPMLLVC